MEVRIEKQTDGTYMAYNVGVKGMVAIGTGESVNEAKLDFENSLEEMAADMDEEEKKEKLSNPEYIFDISSLFEYYKMINVTAFARRIGMNDALLRQYKKGNVYISESQVQRIEEGIHQLGKELCELHLI